MWTSRGKHNKSNESGKKMTHFILGIFSGIGLVFSIAAIIEVDERKKKAEWKKFEEWGHRLP